MAEVSELPENIFFVDTEVKIIKMGMKLRPLVVGKESLFLGKKEEHFSIKEYLSDPVVGKVFTGFASLSELREKTQSAIPNLMEKFEEIKFNDIKSINSRKLLTGDFAIDIKYLKNSKEEKLSLFVVNQYNTLSKETEKLFNILKSKI